MPHCVSRVVVANVVGTRHRTRGSVYSPARSMGCSRRPFYAPSETNSRQKVYNYRCSEMRKEGAISPPDYPELSSSSSSCPLVVVVRMALHPVPDLEPGLSSLSHPIPDALAMAEEKTPFLLLQCRPKNMRPEERSPRAREERTHSLGLLGTAFWHMGITY